MVRVPSSFRILPRHARFCKDSFSLLFFIHTKTPVAQTVSSCSDLPLAHLLQTHPRDRTSVLLHCALNREKDCQESSYRILHLDRLCGVAAAAAEHVWWSVQSTALPPLRSAERSAVIWDGIVCSVPFACVNVCACRTYLKWHLYLCRRVRAEGLLQGAVCVRMFKKSFEV